MRLPEKMLKKASQQLPKLSSLIINSDKNYTDFIISAVNINEARKKKGRFIYEVENPMKPEPKAETAV